jgi:hypothetical protein
VPVSVDEGAAERISNMGKSPAPSASLPAWEGAAIEYAALRGEILTRIGLRQQIMAGTLTLGGVLLAVGIERPPLALLYPPLAAFLAFAWAQNDHRIRHLAAYVEERLEPLLPALGWERHMRSIRGGGGLGSWRFVVIAHGGVFLFTQLLAVGLGIEWVVRQIELREQFFGWGMAGSGLVAIGVVVWILRKSSR